MAASAARKRRSIPRLLRSGHQPKDSPGTVEHRIRQRHAPPFLIDAGYRDIPVRDIENRVAGHQGRRVAVRAEPEVREIEHWRTAGELFEGPCVGVGCGLQILILNRHGVDVLRRKRRALEQALAQARKVSVGVPRRGNPFIHLHHVHAHPRHILIRQCAQHLPRRTPAAHGHHEAASRGLGGARFRGDESGRFPCGCIRVRRCLDSHFGYGPVTTGFCQPPGGVTCSTSAGPHVDGSYSKTGVCAFNAASTIRQASST